MANDPGEMKGGRGVPFIRKTGHDSNSRFRKIIRAQLAVTGPSRTAAACGVLTLTSLRGGLPSMSNQNDFSIHNTGKISTMGTVDTLAMVCIMAMLSIEDAQNAPFLFIQRPK